MNDEPWDPWEGIDDRPPAPPSAVPPPPPPPPPAAAAPPPAPGGQLWVGSQPYARPYQRFDSPVHAASPPATRRVERWPWVVLATVLALAGAGTLGTTLLGRTDVETGAPPTMAPAASSAAPTSVVAPPSTVLGREVVHEGVVRFVLPGEPEAETSAIEVPGMTIPQTVWRYEDGAVSLAVLVQTFPEDVTDEVAPDVYDGAVAGIERETGGRATADEPYVDADGRPARRTVVAVDGASVHVDLRVHGPHLLMIIGADEGADAPAMFEDVKASVRFL